jgi:hypothetical protein
VAPPLAQAADIRTELQAILASAVFARAERPSQFLRYICEATLKGEGSKLNEYLIAHDVFGRGADYSPGEDSVVRRQAHALRHKLQEFYAIAEHPRTVRIELPSGGYVPAFIFEKHLQPQTHAPPPEVPPEPPTVLPRRTNPIALICAAVSLLAIGWAIGASSRNHTKIDPAVAEIWGPWLTDVHEAILCFSNPMTAVVKRFDFTMPEELHGNPPRVAVSSPLAQVFREYFQLPAGGNVYLYPAKSQSKMGEALGSVRIASLLTRAGVVTSSTQSRFLSWESFREQNLILLGHDEANPWLDPILTKLPIRMVSSDGVKGRHMLVARGAGKPESEYYLRTINQAERISRDYGLVSMIAGVDGHQQLLLINGLNTEGTQIAMEYLCDPRAARELLGRLKQAAPNHTGIWHFQFLLETEVRDQVPTKAILLVVKVL